MHQKKKKKRDATAGGNQSDSARLCELSSPEREVALDLFTERTDPPPRGQAGI